MCLSGRAVRPCRRQPRRGDLDGCDADAISLASPGGIAQGDGLFKRRFSPSITRNRIPTVRSFRRTDRRTQRAPTEPEPPQRQRKPTTGTPHGLLLIVKGSTLPGSAQSVAAATKQNPALNVAAFRFDRDHLAAKRLALRQAGSCFPRRAGACDRVGPGGHSGPGTAPVARRRPPEPRSAGAR